jgi:peptidoglycan DL-endopeptidase LytF
VEILPPIETEAAQLIRPGTRSADNHIPQAQPVASGRTHTVKSGENIWRISNQHKVSQKELMAINKITDPTKLKIGQVLMLP